MLAQILAHCVFLKADVLSQLDVRQSFTSSPACPLVNPGLRDFEQSRKLVNCEQSIEIPLREDGDHLVGDVLRISAHLFSPEKAVERGIHRRNPQVLENGSWLFELKKL